MVLQSVNHAINSALCLLHEPVVVLVRLDRVHVASRVQQIAQLRLNVFLFCHVNSKFGHSFLLRLEPLVEAFQLTCSVWTKGALLVEGVREDLEVDHGRFDLVLRLSGHEALVSVVGRSGPVEL